MLGLASSPARAAGEADTAAPICKAPTQRLDEERFLLLGGIEQWVTIKGESCANPVILFLHGGPGNPLSPYADSIYGAWRKDFTLVQWDQRGAGKTFGRSPPPPGSSLTLERMSGDGIELARYLVERLGKDKVILTGGSWGSILGVHMAKAHPELFSAYVGVAQLVEYRENQSASHAKVIALAREAGDAKTLSTLEALGPPPWQDPRNFGVLRRATRVYEAKRSAPAPKSWWQPAAGYATPGALADYEAGEDFSFLQFVGLQGDGIFSKVDLPRLGTTFRIPVFFILGAEDLVAIPAVSQRYFDSIVAPRKGLVRVPGAGHDPNEAVIAAQYRVMRGL